MTLGEKRRIEHAQSVLVKHPEYVKAALERAFPGERVMANLKKELAWLRAFARGLDEVVMDRIVSAGYAAQLDGRRYGLTAVGLRVLGRAPG